MSQGKKQIHHPGGPGRDGPLDVMKMAMMEKRIEDLEEALFHISDVSAATLNRGAVAYQNGLYNIFSFVSSKIDDIKRKD